MEASPRHAPPRSIKRKGQPGARGGGFSRSAILAPETPDDSDECTFVKKQKPGQVLLAGVPLLGYIRSHIDLDLDQCLSLVGPILRLSKDPVGVLQHTSKVNSIRRTLFLKSTGYVAVESKYRSLECIHPGMCV